MKLELTNAANAITALSMQAMEQLDLITVNTYLTLYYPQIPFHLCSALCCMQFAMHHDNEIQRSQGGRQG